MDSTLKSNLDSTWGTKNKIKTIIRDKYKIIGKQNKNSVIYECPKIYLSVKKNRDLSLLLYSQACKVVVWKYKDKLSYWGERVNHGRNLQC